MRKFPLLCWLLLALISRGRQPREHLTVAVAANLSLAMEEVAQAFTARHGIEVDIVSASSGVLAAQVRRGAPFDLFLSANAKYPEALYVEG